MAKVRKYCISPVVENCAVDTQRGFIHGRQLAQTVIDLDHQARIDAFDFYGGRQLLELIHINYIGMLSRMPCMLLYDFASAFPSVAAAWLFCVSEAVDFLSFFALVSKTCTRGMKHMLSPKALFNISFLFFLVFYRVAH